MRNADDARVRRDPQVAEIPPEPRGTGREAADTKSGEGMAEGDGDDAADDAGPAFPSPQSFPRSAAPAAAALMENARQDDRPPSAGGEPHAANEATGNVSGGNALDAAHRPSPPSAPHLPDAVHAIDPVPAPAHAAGNEAQKAFVADSATGADWTEGAGAWRAYARGVREAPFVPAFILFITFIGYGAMTKDAGLTLAQSVLTTLTIYALPAQVMLVDQIARGAGLLAAAFAVTVTSIRLLPLTVALLPHMRRKSHGALITMAIAHLVAVSMWIESMRRVPHLPPPLRVPFYFGLGTVLLGVSAVGTGLGYLMAAGMPHEAAAALMLMTPLYFLMGLTASALGPADRCAILCGVMLAPLLHVLAPAFDLLLTGLIGGTLTYLVARLRGWKS